MTHSLLPTRPPWATVFRTGRTTAADWVAAFGPALDPVLDVGAGDSPWIRELTANHYFAVAVDPQYLLRAPRAHHAADVTSPDRMDHQDSSPSARTGAPCPAVAGLAQALPFRDRSFRTVYIGYCIQHVPDPVSVLRECLRVATAEGRVVIHPVWARGARRAAACRQPGAGLIPGKQGRRPGLVIDPALSYSEDSLNAIASALVPSKPIQLAGAWAMRVTVAVLRTTGIGPGAVR